MIILRTIFQRPVDGAAFGIRADPDAAAVRGAERDRVPPAARCGELPCDRGALFRQQLVQTVRPVEPDRFCKRRDRIHERIVEGEYNAGHFIDRSATLKRASHRLFGPGVTCRRKVMSARSDRDRLGSRSATIRPLSRSLGIE
jgi:hypothetical protein